MTTGCSPFIAHIIVGVRFPCEEAGSVREDRSHGCDVIEGCTVELTRGGIVEACPVLVLVDLR